jgi:GT2 family glycosyltransferase
MEKVFIVLPVHNRREVTRKFVECLKRQTHAPYHLILVDDGSTDGTSDMVVTRIDPVTVIHGRGDWWWAGSLQQGLNAVSGMHPDAKDVLLLTNDDVLFDDRFIETAVSILRNRPGCLLLARSRDSATGEIAETGVEADGRAWRFESASKPENINCLATRGLFLRWSDALTIGAFRPKLLPHYLSDFEWTIRGRRRGLKCITAPDVSIVSQATGVSGRVAPENVSGIVEFLQVVFSKKNHLNPIHWTFFICMASDVRYIPRNIARVWWRVAREAVRRVTGNRARA